MPFSWLRWFQFFFFHLPLAFFFFFFFFMPFSWSWAVFLLFLSFFLGALCRQLSFFIFFSSFSGGLVPTVVFLLFLFFLFLLKAPHFFFLLLELSFSSFSFFFFWWPCVFSLSFHRLNKPFEKDSYVSWLPLWFTWTQFVIMPWMTCFGLWQQICFMLHLQGPRCGKTFIVVHKHRNTKNTKFTKLYYLWVKGNSTGGERGTIFLSDCFYIVSSQPNQCAAPVAHKFVWPCPALNLNFLVRRQELNSLLFLKSPNPQPTLPVRDVIHILWSQFLSGIFILTSLNHTSSPRAREHLC